MDTQSFAMLVLSARGSRCLRRMYRGWKPSKKQLGGAFRELSAQGFIAASSVGVSEIGRVRYGDPYYISDSGKSYVQYVRDKNMRFKLPLGLSIVAIVVALGSLVVSIIALRRAP